jgi:hypothetical protein
MNHAFVVGSLLSSVLLLQLSGQRPPPDPSAEAQKGTAVIRGRVVAADTAAPIRGATVTLSSTRARVARLARTDADGRYEIEELPAGRFAVTVSAPEHKPTYLSSTSLPGSDRRPRLIELAEGQTLRDIDFALPRAGAIGGRVVDEFGDPMAWVRVSTLVRVPGSGPGPAGQRSGETDDAGRFRVFGLPPGEYYLKAEASGAGPRSYEPEGPREGYVQTYYPGTTNLAEAPLVKLELAQEVGDLEIQMMRSRTYRITGLVLDSQGRPAAEAQVSLSHSLSASGRSIYTFGRAAASDGTFEFTRLTPGDYVLTARPAGTTGFAGESSGPTKVTVSGADLDGITLTMRSGLTLAGQIVTDEGALPPGRPTGLSVRPTTVDEILSTAGGPASSGSVRDDWTFEVRGVFAPLLLRLDGRPPEGYFLKAVLHRDTDITDTPTEFTENTTARDLQVVLSRRGAVLTGLVTDAAGRAPDRCTVVLFSAEPARRGSQSTRTRQTGTLPNGSFRIAGMPPGDYLVVAIDGSALDSFGAPSIFEPLVPLATRITLTESVSQEVNLQLRRLDER